VGRLRGRDRVDVLGLGGGHRRRVVALGLVGRLDLGRPHRLVESHRGCLARLVVAVGGVANRVRTRGRGLAQGLVLGCLDLLEAGSADLGGLTQRLGAHQARLVDAPRSRLGTHGGLLRSPQGLIAGD
jgi:hypothetical protein